MFGKIHKIEQSVKKKIYIYIYSIKRNVQRHVGSSETQHSSCFCAASLSGSLPLQSKSSIRMIISLYPQRSLLHIPCVCKAT